MKPLAALDELIILFNNIISIITHTITYVKADERSISVSSKKLLGDYGVNHDEDLISCYDDNHLEHQGFSSHTIRFW